MGKFWEQGELDQDESSASPVPSERGSGSWSEDSFESEDSSYQSTARGSGVSIASPSVSSRETSTAMEPRMGENEMALHRQTAFDEELSQYSEHEVEEELSQYSEHEIDDNSHPSQPQEEQWEEESHHSDSYTSASRSRYSDYSSRRSSFASSTGRGDASQDVPHSNHDDQGSYHSSDSGSAGSAPSYDRGDHNDAESWDQGSYQSPPTSESPGTSRGGGSATSTRDAGRSDHLEAGERSSEPGDLGSYHSDPSGSFLSRRSGDSASRGQSTASSERSRESQASSFSEYSARRSVDPQQQGESNHGSFRSEQTGNSYISRRSRDSRSSSYGSRGGASHSGRSRDSYSSRRSDYSSRRSLSPSGRRDEHADQGSYHSEQELGGSYSSRRSRGSRSSYGSRSGVSHSGRSRGSYSSQHSDSRRSMSPSERKGEHIDEGSYRSEQTGGSYSSRRSRGSRSSYGSRSGASRTGRSRESYSSRHSDYSSRRSLSPSERRGEHADQGSYHSEQTGGSYSSRHSRGSGSSYESRSGRSRGSYSTRHSDFSSRRSLSPSERQGKDTNQGSYHSEQTGGSYSSRRSRDSRSSNGTRSGASRSGRSRGSYSSRHSDYSSRRSLSPSETRGEHADQGSYRSGQTGGSYASRRSGRSRSSHGSKSGASHTGRSRGSYSSRRSDYSSRLPIDRGDQANNGDDGSYHYEQSSSHTSRRSTSPGSSDASRSGASVPKPSEDSYSSRPSVQSSQRSMGPNERSQEQEDLGSFRSDKSGSFVSGRSGTSDGNGSMSRVSQNSRSSRHSDYSTKRSMDEGEVEKSDSLISRPSAGTFGDRGSKSKMSRDSSSSRQSGNGPEEPMVQGVGDNSKLDQGSYHSESSDSQESRHSIPRGSKSASRDSSGSPSPPHLAPLEKHDEKHDDSGSQSDKGLRFSTESGSVSSKRSDGSRSSHGVHSETSVSQRSNESHSSRHSYYSSKRSISPSERQNEQRGQGSLHLDISGSDTSRESGMSRGHESVSSRSRDSRSSRSVDYSSRRSMVEGEGDDDQLPQRSYQSEHSDSFVSRRSGASTGRSSSDSKSQGSVSRSSRDSYLSRQSGRPRDEEVVIGQRLGHSEDSGSFPSAHSSYSSRQPVDTFESERGGGDQGSYQSSQSRRSTTRHSGGSRSSYTSRGSHSDPSRDSHNIGPGDSYHSGLSESFVSKHSAVSQASYSSRGESSSIGRSRGSNMSRHSVIPQESENDETILKLHVSGHGNSPVPSSHSDVLKEADLMQSSHHSSRNSIGEQERNDDQVGDHLSFLGENAFEPAFQESAFSKVSDVDDVDESFDFEPFTPMGWDVTEPPSNTQVQLASHDPKVQTPKDAEQTSGFETFDSNIGVTTPVDKATSHSLRNLDTAMTPQSPSIVEAIKNNGLEPSRDFEHSNVSSVDEISGLFDFEPFTPMGWDMTEPSTSDGGNFATVDHENMPQTTSITRRDDGSQSIKPVETDFSGGNDFSVSVSIGENVNSPNTGQSSESSTGSKEIRSYQVGADDMEFEQPPEVLSDGATSKKEVDTGFSQLGCTDQLSSNGFDMTSGEASSSSEESTVPGSTRDSNVSPLSFLDEKIHGPSHTSKSHVTAKHPDTTLCEVSSSKSQKRIDATSKRDKKTHRPRGETRKKTSFGGGNEEPRDGSITLVDVFGASKVDVRQLSQTGGEHTKKLTKVSRKGIPEDKPESATARKYSPTVSERQNNGPSASYEESVQRTDSFDSSAPSSLQESSHDDADSESYDSRESEFYSSPDNSAHSPASLSSRSSVGSSHGSYTSRSRSSRSRSSRTRRNKDHGTSRHSKSRSSRRRGESSRWSRSSGSISRDSTSMGGSSLRDLPIAEDEEFNETSSPNEIQRSDTNVDENSFQSPSESTSERSERSHSSRSEFGDAFDNQRQQEHTTKADWPEEEFSFQEDFSNQLNSSSNLEKLPPASTEEISFGAFDTNQFGGESLSKKTDSPVRGASKLAGRKIGGSSDDSTLSPFGSEPSNEPDIDDFSAVEQANGISEDDLNPSFKVSSGKSSISAKSIDQPRKVTPSTAVGILRASEIALDVLTTSIYTTLQHGEFLAAVEEAYGIILEHRPRTKYLFSLEEWRHLHVLLFYHRVFICELAGTNVALEPEFQIKLPADLQVFEPLAVVLSSIGVVVDESLGAKFIPVARPMRKGEYHPHDPSDVTEFLEWTQYNWNRSWEEVETSRDARKAMAAEDGIQVPEKCFPDTHLNLLEWESLALEKWLGWDESLWYSYKQLTRMLSTKISFVDFPSDVTGTYSWLLPTVKTPNGVHCKVPKQSLSSEVWMIALMFDFCALPQSRTDTWYFQTTPSENIPELREKFLRAGIK